MPIWNSCHLIRYLKIMDAWDGIHRKIERHCLKGQRALFSTRLGNLFPCFVPELLLGLGLSPRLRLLARAVTSWGCHSPAGTQGCGLTVLYMLCLWDSLTCGFAQLKPDVVKPFLRSGEQRPSLWHGATITKTSCEEVTGVIGERSLCIHLPTCDFGWVVWLLCTLVSYLYGGVSLLPSVQRVVEKALQAGRSAGGSATEPCGESWLLHEVESAGMWGWERQAGAAHVRPDRSYTSSLWCEPASNSDIEELTAPRCLLSAYTKVSAFLQAALGV